MGINSGTSAISKMYVGSTLVSAAYAGSVSVLGLSTLVDQYVLNNPTSASDHGTVSGAGAVTAYETIDGVNVVSVTAAAGVNTTINFSSFTGRLIPEGKITFGIHIPDMVKLGSITLYLGDNASFNANTFTCQLTNSSAVPLSGWYEIVVDPKSVGQWATLTESSQRKWVTGVGSAAFDTTLFTNVKAMIATASGVPCKVSFAECAINKRNSKGQICFVMDDGVATQYTAAKPILEANGMRASLGIIATLVGAGGYMNLTQLQAMRDAGHECIVHGSTTLTSLADLSAIQTEIAVHRDYLVNNGLAVNGSEKCYLYPGNVTRGATPTGNDGGEIIHSALVNLGFIGARTTSVTGALVSKYMSKGGLWMVPEIGHRAVTTTEALETANVDRVILRMQQAVALGRGFVITNHAVVADTPGTAPTVTTDIQVSNYTRIVEAAKALVDAGTAENVLFSTLVKRMRDSTV